MTTIHYTNGTSIEYDGVTITESGWVKAQKVHGVVHSPPGQIREIDGEVSYDGV